MTYQPTGLSRRRRVTVAAHMYLWVIKPEAAEQALYTQQETRNYEPEIWKDSDF